MSVNWRVRLIMALDYLDHRVLGHPSFHLCQIVGTSPFWSLLTAEQREAHRRRVGLPRKRPALRRLIVANPHIQAGVPVIRGTRIPTRAPWCFWCAGYTIGAIKQEYPSLSAERIWAAIHFERQRRQRTRLRVRQRTPMGRKVIRMGEEGNVANELDDGTDLLREGIRSISACASCFETADERAELRLIADEMQWLLARAMLLRGRYQERHFPRTDP